MADFTAKEMRKLANLMESAVQGHEPSSEKQEQIDVCHMLYQAIKKSDELGGEEGTLIMLLSQMTYGAMDNPENLKREEWVYTNGHRFVESSMVKTFNKTVERELAYNFGDDDILFSLEDSEMQTFKELIVELEGTYTGNHNIMEMVPYIKLLDTLPLL